MLYNKNKTEKTEDKYLSIFYEDFVNAVVFVFLTYCFVVFFTKLTPDNRLAFNDA